MKTQYILSVINNCKYEFCIFNNFVPNDLKNIGLEDCYDANVVAVFLDDKTGLDENTWIWYYIYIENGKYKIIMKSGLEKNPASEDIDVTNNTTLYIISK
jgi:hypothetical protein